MSTSSRTKEPVSRDRVRPGDTWDLSSLFSGQRAWEGAMRRFEGRIPRYREFRGTLGRSPRRLAAALAFDLQTDRLAERIGTYAFLRSCEDLTSSAAQGMLARYRNAASRAAREASFLRPEVLAMARGTLRRFLAHPSLAPYRILLERILRFRPHTLGRAGEELLAMQSEMAGAADRIFSRLNDADLRFGSVRNERGEPIELSHATFQSLLQSPDRGVRRRAFRRYYRQYAAHENSIAATLEGSVLADVYYARARRHPSSLAAALFPDRIPEKVYTNLIRAVRSRLPSVHRYYELRRRLLGLREIHPYDTYVPILHDRRRRRSWGQAVRTVLEATAPLGGRYTGVLRRGLEGRWCDRYENRGKHSGAFSCGSYDGDPYILMNYRPDLLDHLFTLAHEAGHSMHSYLSARRQPFQYHDYSLFVAEVASTFHEQLLGRHLLARARGRLERAYLVNREIDAMRGTLIRQTMFAEFEKTIHEIAERNEPLTLGRFKEEYRALLEAYFGPRFALDEELSLECLRIPHFYRAFYVYKYATGMSAAIALCDRVLEGGGAERRDYLEFLARGCSRDPLDLLRGAGVDLEEPEAVESALGRFEDLVGELEKLLGRKGATGKAGARSPGRRAGSRP